jgi:hypothetical protein
VRSEKWKSDCGIWGLKCDVSELYLKRLKWKKREEGIVGEQNTTTYVFSKVVFNQP